MLTSVYRPKEKGQGTYSLTNTRKMGGVGEGSGEGEGERGSARLS